MRRATPVPVAQKPVESPVSEATPEKTVVAQPAQKVETLKAEVTPVTSKVEVTSEAKPIATEVKVKSEGKTSASNTDLTAEMSAPATPMFIEAEGEAPTHEHRRQKKHRNGKWRNKQEQRVDAPASHTPPTPAEQDAAEVGPQTRHLTLLGNKTVYSDRYTPAILEAFDNRHPENDYFVKFNCPEFTSLCPITGQPDFATIYISYIPDRKMVESKSLKLYLFGFRNHGAFHEDCVNIIMKDLIKLMSPRYIEVWGKFLPRGGLSIDPYVNYGRPTTKWEEFARQRLLMHDLSPEIITNR
jgi:7-cyano-7-deazaguanine reductase